MHGCEPNTICNKDHDRAFVIGAVLATDSHVIAIAYDLHARGWVRLYLGANDSSMGKPWQQSFAEAEAVLEEAASALETTGTIGGVVGRDVDDEVDTVFRDADELSGVLRQHYEANAGRRDGAT